MLKPTRVFFKAEKYDEEKDIIVENEIPMSLSYGLLYQLKALHKGIFERYNTIVTKGGEDEFDNIFLLYVGYLCAHIEDVKNKTNMSEVEFIDCVPDDREYVAGVIEKLLAPNKKKQASAVRSSKGRTR